MLVLARALGERVIIACADGTITITILAIGHGQVKVGIAAPAHIRIQRAELRDRPPATAPDQAQADRPEEPDT